MGSGPAGCAEARGGSGRARRAPRPRRGTSRTSPAAPPAPSHGRAAGPVTRHRQTERGPRAAPERSTAHRSFRRALPHWPDLDGARAGQWNSCGDGDGFVEVLDVDEHVAAELLAGLRERTVGHEALAVAHPDAGRRRRRVQRETAQILPARRELFRDLQGLPVDLLSLGHAEPVPGRLVAANQQHVFHVGLHRYVERRGPESTPRRRLSNLEYAPGCKRSRRGGLSLRLGWIVATLIRLVRDFDVAEEAAQEAFAAAVGQ